MLQGASRELSDIAYRKRFEKWKEKNKSVTKCVCDKIRSLFGRN